MSTWSLLLIMHGQLHAQKKARKFPKKKSCGCWDSSPGLHGHNVEFSPLNYSHSVALVDYWTIITRNM
jgi:hypothetical protein